MIKKDGIIAPLWGHMLYEFSIFLIVVGILKFFWNLFVPDFLEISGWGLFVGSFVYGILQGMNSWVEDVKVNSKENFTIIEE